MKKIIFLNASFLFFISQVLSQACLFSGTIFTNQNQIDNFPSEFPTCKKIVGKVTINWSSGGNIDLSGLNQIEELGDDLIILDSDMSSLSGMTGLKKNRRECRFLQKPSTHKHFIFP